MWSMQLIADVGCGWLIRAIQTVNSTSFPCLFEFLFFFSAISGDVMFSLINSMSSCGTSMNASRLFSQLFTFTCDFNEIFTVLDCNKKTMQMYVRFLLLPIIAIENVASCIHENSVDFQQIDIFEWQTIFGCVLNTVH